jgi:membrane protein YqaA with SNARE-associated domain
MFTWAVAEATVWPFIPDVLLAPMAAANRRRFYVPLLAAIAGMAAGGCALYLLAYWDGDAAMRFLERVPLVSERQIEEVQRRLSRDGVPAFLVQPWSGVPFKVWAVVGGGLGLSPWQAIPTFIVARALRMTVVALLARALGARFAEFLRDHSLLVAALYIVLFLAGWWLVTG